MNLTSYYSPLESDIRSDLQNVLFPIYYLFDKDINNKSGTTQNARTNIRNFYKLDELFLLVGNNIAETTYGLHATILYNIKINTDDYIIYSNSGLGIESNNIKTNLDGTDYTVNRLFKKNNLFKNFDICGYIIFFMEEISSYSKHHSVTIAETRDKIKSAIINKFNTCEEDLTKQNIFNLNVTTNFNNLYDDIKSENKNKTYLIYALLILFCKMEYITEHLLTNIIGYIHYDINIIDNSINLYHIYTHCLSNTYLEKYNVTPIRLFNNYKRQFDGFVSFINTALESESIRSNQEFTNTFIYSRNMFKIKHNEFGILNTIQNSGSCTFYSYFNLGITNLILNLYLDNQKTLEIKSNEYITNCMKFHKNMINLLCITNDSLYKTNTVNNLFFDNYIYKLLRDNNLTEDIISTYNIPNKLIFNLKEKSGIDNLLPDNIIINNNLNPVDYVIINCNYYIDLQRFLKTQIHKVRNKKKIDIIEFYNFKRDKINFNSSINPLEVSQFGSGLFNTLLNVYYIYLCTLSYIILNNIRDESILSRYSKCFYYNYYTTNNTVCFDIPIYDPLFLILDYQEIISIFKFTNKYKNIEDLKNAISIKDSINNSYIMYRSYNITNLIKNKNININDIYYDNNLTIKNIDNYIEILKYKYIICNSILDNKFYDKTLIISDPDKINIYKITKKKIYNIINKIKGFVFNNISICTIISILTNCEYSFISYDSYFFDNGIVYSNKVSNFFIDNYSIINDYTKVIYYKDGNYMDIIYKYIKKENNINIEFIEKTFLNNYYEQYFSWYEKKYYIKLEEYGIQYLSNYSININNYNRLNNSLKKLLCRFSINYNNFNQIKLLTTQNRPIGPSNICYLFIITSVNFILPYRVFIIKYNQTKIFYKEIIMINNDKEYKLYFDLNITKYPFAQFIPSYVPYLMYRDKNNNYTIELISSSCFYHNKGYFYKSLDKEYKEETSYENLYVKINISPSYYGPINNFNTIDYIKICDRHYHNNVKLDLNNPIMKKFMKNEENFLKEIFVENNENNVNININNKKNINNVNNVNINNVNNENIKNKYIDYINNKLFDFCESKIHDIETKLSFINKINSINNKNNKEKYIEHHKLCKLNDKNDKNHKPNFKLFKKIIKIIIKKNIKNIIKFIDFNQYLTSNIYFFINIMKCNILYDVINKIINNVSCWEIKNHMETLDSIKCFNENIDGNNFFGFEIFYLIQCTFFYKRSQLDKYFKIREDLIKKNPTLKLHQFMMGKGKTSVFTPLLSLCVNFIKEKTATIITASHLVIEVEKILSLSKMLIDLKINIYSDFDAKLRWINNIKNNNIRLNEEYNIIDEFDSHYNYLNSIFNSVEKKYPPLEEDTFNYIFNETYAIIKKNKNRTNLYKYPHLLNNINELYPHLLNNINELYHNCIKSVYQTDYGFSFLYFNQNDTHRLCSPFSRKDTPVKDSNFSSILYTLLLTFKTYIKIYNCELTDNLHDYRNATNILLDLRGIHEELDKYIVTYDVLVDEEINITNLKYICETYIYIDDGMKINLLLKYLYNVNKNKIDYVETQLNISFQDLIYNNYSQWQVGYTGTAYLELFNYKDVKEFVFSNNIIKDSDEKFDILFAIYGYGKKKIDENIYVINISENIKNKTINNSNNNNNNNNNDNKQSKKTICNILNKLNKSNKSIQNHKNNKFIINRSNINDNNINYIKDILQQIQDNPRGFIDLHGLFLNYTNENIAREISKKLPTYNIIFLDKDHNQFQLKNNGIKENFKGVQENNFYYYDQCHIVGTDIKQPQEGHVAIIINKSTKMSDFAQAIFRFRQLNKGTYLSIILIEEEEHRRNYSLNTIYKLLNKNQDAFIKKQKDGIKLQIFKTIIRKNTRNYSEINLKPEFIRKEGEEISIQNIVKDNIFNKMTYYKLIENIVNIQEKNLLKDISDDLLNDEYKKIKILILGKKNMEQEQEQEQTKEIHKEKQKETNSTILGYINSIKIFNHLKINKVYLITDTPSINNCCIKLFNSDNIKINDKHIYISYNFICNIDSNFISKDELSSIVFIEFKNMILIETKLIGMLYYLNKLPVYSFEDGKIINSILAFNNEFTLNINKYFIKLFNLDIPIIENIKDEEILDILNNDIEDAQFYIIKIMLKLYFNNVHPKLPKIIENMSEHLLIKLSSYIPPYSPSQRVNTPTNFYNLNYSVNLPLIGYNLNSNNTFNNFTHKPILNQCIHDSIKQY